MQIFALARRVRRIVGRLARWTVAADCDCAAASTYDRDHAPGCPHPLVRRRRG